MNFCLKKSLCLPFKFCPEAKLTQTDSHLNSLLTISLFVAIDPPCHRHIRNHQDLISRALLGDTPYPAFSGQHRQHRQNRPHRGQHPNRQNITSEHTLTACSDTKKNCVCFVILFIHVYVSMQRTVLRSVHAHIVDHHDSFHGHCATPWLKTW